MSIDLNINGVFSSFSVFSWNNWVEFPQQNETKRTNIFSFHVYIYIIYSIIQYRLVSYLYIYNKKIIMQMNSDCCFPDYLVIYPVFITADEFGQLYLCFSCHEFGNYPFFSFATNINISLKKMHPSSSCVLHWRSFVSFYWHKNNSTFPSLDIPLNFFFFLFRRS